MSVDPLASTGTPAWVQALDARMAKAVEHVDGLINNIFGAFTDKLDGATASLAEKAGEMGSSMARGASGLSAGLSPNGLTGPSKTAEGPSQQPEIKQSAELPDHVKSQAMAAVGGTFGGVGMPGLQAANSNTQGAAVATNVTHIEEAQLGNISPSATYGIGAQRSQGLAVA